MERLTAALVGQRLDRVEIAINQARNTYNHLGSENGPRNLVLDENLPPFDTLKRISQIARARLNLKGVTLPILETHRGFEKRVLESTTRAQEAEEEMEHLWQQHPDYDNQYLKEAVNDPAKNQKNSLAAQIVQAKMSPLLRYRSRRVYDKPEGQYSLRHEEFYEVPLPNGQKLRTKSPRIAFIVEELKKASVQHPLDFRAMLLLLTGTIDFQTYTTTQVCMLDTEKLLQKKGYKIIRTRTTLAERSGRYGTADSRICLYLEETQNNPDVEQITKSPVIAEKEEAVDLRLTLRKKINGSITNISQIRRLRQSANINEALSRRAEKAYDNFIRTQPLQLVTEAIIYWLQKTGRSPKSQIPMVLSVVKDTNPNCTLTHEDVARLLYGNTDPENLFRANGYMRSLAQRLSEIKLGLVLVPMQQPDSTMKPDKWQRLWHSRPLLTFHEAMSYYLDFNDISTSMTPSVN